MVLRACSRLPRLSSARSVLGSGALPPKPTQRRKNYPFFNQGNVNASSETFSRFFFYHLGQVPSQGLAPLRLARGARGQLPHTLTGCGVGPRCPPQHPRPSWPKLGGFGGLSRRQSPRTLGMQGRRGDNCQLSAGQWWHCGAGAGRKGPGSSVMLLFYLRCHSLRREMALFSLILLFRHACWFVLGFGFFFWFCFNPCSPGKAHSDRQ